MQISCNINQLPSCKCHPSAHGSSQRPAAPIHHCPSEGGSCLAERKKMVIQNMLEKMVVSYCNQVVASTSEMIVIGDHHLGSSSQSHFCIWLRITNMYMYIYIHIIFNNIFNNMVTWGHCPRMEGSEMSRNRIKIWFLDYISYTVQYACVNVLFSAGSSLNSAMVPTFMESAFLRRLITPSLKVQCQWLIARGIKFRNVKRAW